MERFGLIRLDRLNCIDPNLIGKCHSTEKDHNRKTMQQLQTIQDLQILNKVFPRPLIHTLAQKPSHPKKEMSCHLAQPIDTLCGRLSDGHQLKARPRWPAYRKVPHHAPLLLPKVSAQLSTSTDPSVRLPVWGSDCAPLHRHVPCVQSARPTSVSRWETHQQSLELGRHKHSK